MRQSAYCPVYKKFEERRETKEHQMYLFAVSITVSYASVFFYSCCSHLEHRTSVKCFVSLHFLNLWESVTNSRTPWTGGQLVQGRYLTQAQTSIPWPGFKSTIQSSSGRRRFMLQTARPLLYAMCSYTQHYFLKISSCELLILCFSPAATQVIALVCLVNIL
jgi:hypothetical protein